MPLVLNGMALHSSAGAELLSIGCCARFGGEGAPSASFTLLPDKAKAAEAAALALALALAVAAPRLELLLWPECFLESSLDFSLKLSVLSRRASGELHLLSC